MRQNADLLTQHVSGTNMPIIRSTIVSSALVSKPGKLPGLCSAGLLDVCTAWRMWPNGPHPPSSTHLTAQRYTTTCGHILQAVHTSNSPALHNPGNFPGLDTKAELTIVLLMMGILVPETCCVNKSAYFVASSWS